MGMSDLLAQVFAGADTRGSTHRRATAFVQYTRDELSRSQSAIQQIARAAGVLKGSAVADTILQLTRGLR